MLAYSSFLVQGAEEVTNGGSYRPPNLLLFKRFSPSDTDHSSYIQIPIRGDDIWLFFKIKMDIVL